MSDRVALKLVRPYDTEADYLASEAWTISRKSLLLADQGPLTDGTVVRCQVTLRSGGKLIEAEGVADGQIAPRDDRPGGLKLRLSRMSPATQKLIKRALAARAKSVSPGSAPDNSAPVNSAPVNSAPVNSVPVNSVPVNSVPVNSVPLDSVPLHSAPKRSTPARSTPPRTNTSRSPSASARSTPEQRRRALAGLAVRAGAQVGAPKNRDAMLTKLRERGSAQREAG